MFEFERDIVEALVNDDKQFEELYNQHHVLKEKVKNAELGVFPLNDVALGDMKKQKLLTKDRMAAMIADYKRTKKAS